MYSAYYYMGMPASIHLSKNISPRTARILVVLGILLCAVLGAFLPSMPYAVCGAAAAESALIGFGLYRGRSSIRFAVVLFTCAFAAVSAWLMYLFDRTPVSPVAGAEDAAGVICRFIVWASALPCSFMLVRVLYSAGSAPADTKRTIFRLLLYAECYVVAVMLSAMDSRGTAPPTGLLISTGLFLAGYVGAAVGYRKHVRMNAEDQLRAEELQQELGEQKAQFESLAARLAALRRTKHDLNNHLTIVATLMRDGKRNEARAYVNALIGSIEAPHGPSLTATSLARSRTEALEKNGVRVRYPDVRGLVPAARALVWPWTEKIIEIAGKVLPGARDARLEMEYVPEPLTVQALFAPTSKETVRPLLTQAIRQMDSSTAAVLLGEDRDAGTVRVAVVAAESFVCAPQDPPCTPFDV